MSRKKSKNEIREEEDLKAFTEWCQDMNQWVLPLLLRDEEDPTGLAHLKEARDKLSKSSPRVMRIVCRGGKR
jgi:hypothetical protein